MHWAVSVNLQVQILLNIVQQQFISQLASTANKVRAKQKCVCFRKMGSCKNISSWRSRCNQHSAQTNVLMSNIPRGTSQRSVVINLIQTEFIKYKKKQKLSKNQKNVLRSSNKFMDTTCTFLDFLKRFPSSLVLFRLHYVFSFYKQLHIHISFIFLQALGIKTSQE